MLLVHLDLTIFFHRHQMVMIMLMTMLIVLIVLIVLMTMVVHPDLTKTGSPPHLHLEVSETGNPSRSDYV